MKIESNLFSPQQIAADNTTSSVESARAASSSQVLDPAAAAAFTTGGDHAHLSESALLASAAVSQTDVRIDKIAAVQQSLANGSYSVSPSDLADKLIDHLLQH